MRILLTGISGFIGANLAQRLQGAGHVVAGVIRQTSKLSPSLLAAGIELYRTDDIASEERWLQWLQGVDVVVHLAARVHVMHETSSNPLESFRRVNVSGMRRLAEAAAAAGVRRFIYLSTIKVNGERTLVEPFRADEEPAPVEPYAVSKHEAEQVLRHICAASDMEYVIIRPPLVYGPGVKGNFERLIHLVLRGVPLPLAAVTNRRSMVSLDNLTDFIVVCMTHPGAANETFLISDGDDWSTPQLIEAIARHLNQSPRLFRFPVRLMTSVAGFFGKSALIDRLCGSLRVDITKSHELLGWQAPQSPDDGVRSAVEAVVRGKPDD